MKSKIDIFSIANRCLKIAEKSSSNLKCAEVFFGRNKYLNIEIEENSVKNAELGLDEGISIRVIDNRGSLGFAYVNNLKKQLIQERVETAIKMMNAGTEDLDFQDLPSQYEKYPKIDNLFDPNLKNLQIEDSITYAKDLIKICENDELAISQSANFVSNYSKRYIFNTNGIEISGKETSCSISSNIIVKDELKKETSFGYEWQSERNLKKINATKIAEKALVDAKRNLNRIKIKSMKIPIILTPKGTISFILSPIANAINAETFQYQRSFLVNKRNEVIGSEQLSVEDNALLDGFAGSNQFDGEGVPCKNKEIIKNGKFLGLLHNSYTAGKEGVESTGNASRRSYSSIPSIGISNFIMNAGHYSLEELLNVKNGILLDYTGDAPNIATGDFSGLILHGNVIENGKIKEPLNETMFGVNLLDLFENIDAISKETNIYGAYHAPYVRIKNVQIIGSGS
jgi:PmbA protein